MSTCGRPAAALAALVSACVVVDTSELRILPETPLEAEYLLRVSVSCPCTRVALDIDGDGIPGDFPVGVEFDVPVGESFDPGEHVLRARALDGSIARSVSRSFMVRRGQSPVLDVTPAPGGLAPADPITDGPFVAEIRFARAVVPARVTSETVHVPGEISTASVLPDGRTLRVELARSLDTIGALGQRVELVVAGEVLDPPWPRPGWRFVWTLLPPTEVQVALPTPVDNPYGNELATSGVIELPLRVSGTYLPPWIDIVIGSTATLRVPRPSTGSTYTTSWNSAAAAEGLYRVVLRGPPDFRLSYTSRYIRVDRTPPTFVRCDPRPWPTTPSRDECVAFVMNEDVGGVEGALVRTGGVLRTMSLQQAQFNEAVLCPTPLALEAQASEQEFEATVRDRAGNRSQEMRCTVPTPLWESRWGAGPFTDLPPAVAVLPGSGRPWEGSGSPGDTWLLALGAPGSPEAGDLLQRYSWYPGPASRLLNRVGGEAEGAGWAWIERQPGGQGEVYAWIEDPSPSAYGRAMAVGPLNRDPTRDARDAATWRTPGKLIVWSEEADDGWAIAAHHQSGPLGAIPRRSAGSVADSPSVADGAEVVAWLEGGPGMPRRLQVAQIGLLDGPSTRWDDLLTDGNLSPDEDAAEPVVARSWLATAVAWREGGRVLARYARHGDAFGPPMVLNADPARPARSPRLDGGSWGTGDRMVAYWIEEGPEGERILAREWHQSGWSLAPEAVNEGVPGPVGAIGVAPALVAWVGVEGGVYLRYASCFY